MINVNVIYGIYLARPCSSFANELGGAGGWGSSRVDLLATVYSGLTSSLHGRPSLPPWNVHCILGKRLSCVLTRVFRVSALENVKSCRAVIPRLQRTVIKSSFCVQGNLTKDKGSTCFHHLKVWLYAAFHSYTIFSFFPFS